MEGDMADDTLPYGQTPLLQIFLADALGGLQFQPLIPLIEDPERANLRVHHIGCHGDDQAEHVLKIETRSDGLADLQKGIDLPGVGSSFFFW